MSDPKSTAWREGLKNKPFRYWIRDEIEEIVKEENVDRSRFHEASKLEYESIIRKFYYSFCDYENHPKVHLEYVWLHFHERLKHSEPFRCGDWCEYIGGIETLIPEEQRSRQFYLIQSDGWVYEGYVKEIMTVLSEVDGLIDDFYVVSKHFDWFIAHTDDGDCMVYFYK